MDQLSLSLRAGVALNRCGFRPTHSLGQNFIMDEEFLNHLLDISNLDKSDNVLEIGPGPGIMTSLIAQRANRVFALEADQRLDPVLTEMLSETDNAGFMIADALRANIDRIVAEQFGDQDYRVIANLPYYITADLILKMLSAKHLPETICVMVQKEAADRLMSEPGDKNWGALAATVRYYCDCTVLEDVPPARFDPMPHVDSCFIRLDTKTDRPFAREEEPKVVRLIQACFLMRRKTLANNLRSSYGMSADEAANVIRKAGLSDKIRGEVLSMEQLYRLYEIIKNG